LAAVAFKGGGESFHYQRTGSSGFIPLLLLLLLLLLELLLVVVIRSGD
jgi:hypothetical protein